MKPIKAIHDSFWNKDDSFRNEAEMFRVYRYQSEHQPPQPGAGTREPCQLLLELTTPQNLLLLRI
jgi:hypothetical protein